VVARSVDQGMGLIVQPTGVQRDHINCELRTADQIQNDHVLQAEAGGEDRRAVPGDRLSQTLRSSASMACNRERECRIRERLESDSFTHKRHVGQSGIGQPPQSGLKLV